MAQRPRDPLSSLCCEKCELYKRAGGCFYVPPDGMKNLAGAHYLIVGEAPGKNEVQEGIPFIGRSGELLRERMARAGIQQELCVISNGALCPPRDGPKAYEIGTPTFEETQYCLPHTLALLTLAPIKVVVAVGGRTFSVLTNNPKAKITAERGKFTTMSLPFPVRYHTFRQWLKLRGILTSTLIHGLSDLHALDYYGNEFDSKDQEKAEEQIKRAVAELGYSEKWMETPLVGVVHPAAILRQGPESTEADRLQGDLEKIRDSVDGIIRPQTATDYAWIPDLPSWEAYVEETIKLYKSGTIHMIAGDCETSESYEGKDYDEVGLVAFDPKINLLSIQFSREDNEARSILLPPHSQSFLTNPMSMQIFCHQLKRLLETVPSVWQNGKFDANVLRCRLGIRDINIMSDTLLMSHWRWSGHKKENNLDELGALYCGTGKHKTPAKEWRVLNPGKDFGDMPLDLALGYACGDADVTRRVYLVLRRQMEKEEMWDSFQNHYFGPDKAWQVLVDLEWAGMKIDKVVLDKLNVVYPALMDEALQKIHEHPYMDQNWYRHEYEIYRKEAEETKAATEQHNATVEAGLAPKGSRKKKVYPVLSYEDWKKDPDNRFNPNSWQQVEKLWCKYINLPFRKDWNKFPNLEYKDLVCNAKNRKDGAQGCGREGDRCRCAVKHIPCIPTTEDGNREILIAVAETKVDEYKDKAPVRAAGFRQFAELTKLFSEFKGFSKMFGTYVKGIYPLVPDKVMEDTSPNERCYELYRPFADFPPSWCIHPSYNMEGTETGRLSSKKPNGQNFPDADEPERDVKRPYYSRHRPGGLILQPDYSQIEVRVMVVACGDEVLTEVLNSGKDVHRFVASLVHNIPEDKVTDAIRKPIKRVTFGILYGQSASSLAQELRKPEEEVKTLMAKFFASFPKIKKFVDEQHRMVKELGYVTTKFGRTRFLPHIDAEKPGEANKALRDAVNTPIQSMASDMCWRAYGRAWQDVKRFGLRALPFSIIHDSQAFDVAAADVFDLIELQYYQMVWRTMELHDWMKVKPEADFAIGATWGGLIKCGLVWKNKEELDHSKLVLSGPVADINAVVEQFEHGGVKVAVEGRDGEHPKPEEAAKGNFLREVRLSRPNPICLLTGRKLNGM